jgi:hypothetical protein
MAAAKLSNDIKQSNYGRAVTDAPCRLIDLSHPLLSTITSTARVTTEKQRAARNRAASQGGNLSTSHIDPDEVIEKSPAELREYASYLPLNTNGALHAFA